MSITSSSPHLLKQAVLELLKECRQRMDDGSMVDMAEVERGIRSYCESIAALPLDEGRKYKEDLQMMMDEVNALSEKMIAARDALKKELQALERMRQASTAYKKSEAMAGRPKKTESGS